MKKLFSALIIFIILTINLFSVQAVSLSDIKAHSYILIDAKSGQVLAGYNVDDRWRPASLTKLMTAILALENGDLNQVMTASLSAVDDIGPGGANIGIMAGEQLRLEDLLNALLIRSANETANIIAENLCPTRKDFIDLMNKKAVELGATHTTFINTCGKDNAKEDANHLSTASDLAKIARYAMTLPELRKIVTKEYLNSMPPTNKHSKWDILRTTNRFLWSNDGNYTFTENGTKYSYTVNGVKTGYTSAAGNNLITSAADSSGMEIISVVLGVKDQGTGKVYTYAKNLLEYGFANYTLQKVAGNHDIVKSNVPVTNAKNNASLNLVTANEVSAVLPRDKNEWNITTKEQINKNIKAPVKQGDVLGEIEYLKNGISLGKVNIVAAVSIEESTKSIVTDTAKNTVNNVIVKRIVLCILLSLLALIIVRVIMKKVSGNIRSKRQQN